MTLFGPEPTPPPAKPEHYARLLAVCDLRYWSMDRRDRQRIGALANRLIGNGIPERKVTEEGRRLRATLGRPPTVPELADRLLG